VREKDGGRYEIIDGWHRTMVLDEMGKAEVRCEVWDVDKKESRLLIATLNRLHGTDDAGKRTVLLGQLAGDFKDDLMDLIPESGRSLEALLKKMNADVDDIEADRGLIEDQLVRSGVDPDQAESMANLHRPPSGKMVLTFIFKDEHDYNLVNKFFKGKDKAQTLLSLVHPGATDNDKVS